MRSYLEVTLILRIEFTMLARVIGTLKIQQIEARLVGTILIDREISPKMLRILEYGVNIIRATHTGQRIVGHFLRLSRAKQGILVIPLKEEMVMFGVKITEQTRIPLRIVAGYKIIIKIQIPTLTIQVEVTQEEITKTGAISEGEGILEVETTIITTTVTIIEVVIITKTGAAITITEVIILQTEVVIITTQE